eukprot:TRINITY_DN23591_c0_g4_i1.p1 TRINITY_DN23591_c0_g4~~TRINITY_DN23591_c0_g4_i1.p1  ORF type:complete len:764 (-),score=175.64 TRINITY_DN23591_c0_g4_i1:96-2387(-)
METPVAATPAPSCISTRSGCKLPRADGMRSAFLQRLEAASLSPSPRLPVCGRARFPLRDLVDSDDEGDATSTGGRSSPIRKAGSSQHLLVLRLEAPSKSAGGSPSKRAEASQVQRVESDAEGLLAADEFSFQALENRYETGLGHLQGRNDSLDAAELSGPALRVLEKARAELMQRLSEQPLRPQRRPPAETEKSSSSLVIAADRALPAGRGAFLEAAGVGGSSPVREELIVANVSETPISVGQKGEVRGSPSELSTAPTAAGEDMALATDTAAELPGSSAAHVASQNGSPAGSCAMTAVSAEGDVECPGESCSTVNPWALRRHAGPSSDAAIDAARELLVSELEERLQAGRVAVEDARHEVSANADLERNLFRATRRARDLWAAVESAEVLLRGLQARLDTSTSSPSSARSSERRNQQCVDAEAESFALEELTRAKATEQQLAQRMETLARELQEQSNRPSAEHSKALKKITRLRARTARLQEDYSTVVAQVGLARSSSQQLELEVARLEADWRLMKQDRQRQDEVQESLRQRLAALLLRKPQTDIQKVPLHSLASLVGQDWMQAKRQGLERLTELSAIKEHHQSISSEAIVAQANLERELRKLADAEQELARVSHDHGNSLRVAREELAAAQAEHSVLVEARSSWQKLRPQLMHLVEDLRCSRHAEDPQGARSRSSSREAALHKVPSLALESASSGAVQQQAREDEDAASLRQALQEHEALQAQLQRLEKDKAALIHDQEELIRHVRSRVAPLHQRASAICR